MENQIETMNMKRIGFNKIPKYFSRRDYLNNKLNQPIDKLRRFSASLEGVEFKLREGINYPAIAGRLKRR